MPAVQRPESEATIAAMFDRIAPRYDFLNRLLSMQRDQRWREEMVAQIPYRPGGALLDVATGTGDVLLAAAAARPEYDGLVGVDISEGMLKRAAERTQLAGVSAELKRMSASRLDFAPGTFDCATIAFGLRNVIDRGKAIREFHRILKDQGALLILEFFTPKSSLLAAAFQLYFHHVLPLIGGLVSDRKAYRYLPQSVASMYTPERLRAALYDAGFTVPQEKSFLFGSCRLIKAVKL